jgi:hypothetical protein
VRFLPTAFVGGLAVAALAFIMGTVSPAFASTTTTTIVGWLVPDSTHFANSLLLIMLPLAGLGFFVWIARLFKVTGDAGVYWSLSGLFVGALVTTLPANGTNTNAISFGYIVLIAMLLFLWWWNS